MTKAKQKKDWKRTICVTVEQEQRELLKTLANYMQLNISQVVRELLPSVEEIKAFIALSNYAADDESITKLIAKTRRLFIEVLMTGHPLHPIGMQVAATSYFDKSGDEVMKLFQRYCKALQGGIDYHKIERVDFPMGRKEYQFNIVTSPRESKETVLDLISRYSAAEKSQVVQQQIRTSSKLKTKKSKKTKKRVTKTKKK